MAVFFDAVWAGLETVVPPFTRASARTMTMRDRKRGMEIEVPTSVLSLAVRSVSLSGYLMALLLSPPVSSMRLLLAEE